MIQKQGALVEDFNTGVGASSRGAKVDIPLTLQSTEELLDIDTTQFTRARVYSTINRFKDFVWDGTDWVEIADERYYTQQEIDALFDAWLEANT